MGIGEAAGLLTAVAWASASLLYGKARLPAWQMNLSKNVIAASIFSVQLVMTGLLQGESPLTASSRSVAWLVASGVIGVMIGDTFYLRSLQILGPRLALIVSTMAPAFGGVLGWLVLGKPVSVMLWVGIFTTTAGVVWVVGTPKIEGELPGIYPGRLGTGILMGILAALCQALGGVASTIGMRDCGALEASFYRIGTSAVLMLLITPHLAWPTCKQVFSPEVRNKLIPGVLIGTWLGIWLSQVAFKYSHVAVALTLQSTTPLFVLPLMWYFQAQRITRTAILGAVLAIIGVAVTVASQRQETTAETSHPRQPLIVPSS